jgi:hypothetical protein
VYGKNLDEDNDGNITLYAHWDENSIGAGTSASSARPIGEYQQVTASIGNGVNRYYSFVPRTSRTYYFSITDLSYTGHYTYFSVRNSSNASLSTWQLNSNTTFSISLTAGNVYYLVVYPAANVYTNWNCKLMVS